MSDRRSQKCDICKRRSDSLFVDLVTADRNNLRKTLSMCQNCFRFLPSALQRIILSITPDKNIPITTSLVNALKDMDKPKNPISIRYHVLNNCWCVFSKDKLMSLRTKVQCLKYIMGLQEKRIYPHYTFFMGEIVDENVMSKELHGFFKREGVTL